MQTLLDINKLIVGVAPNSSAWRLVQEPLLKTKDILENIYYAHVLQPKLQRAFDLEVSMFTRCIICILWVLDETLKSVTHA